MARLERRGYPGVMDGLARWIAGVGSLALTSAGCIGEHSCTDIGCQSGVTASVKPSSGAWQKGEYTFQLLLDAEQETCSFRVPEDLPQAGSTSVIDCSRGTKTQLLLAVSGPFRLTLTSQPKTWQVELSRDGAPILRDSRTLMYEKSQPNEGCGPICHNASVDLTVQ
jgi:hypothetical protein